MGSKIGLVELKTTNEDGTLLSRLQMEEQLRKETVYHRRLRAFKMGLPNKVAQHMLPISVTHWLLDQWIQKGTITGEILGIRSEFDADDNKDYLRQLTQRLVQFVEHGLAVKPNPGEGIDMSQFNAPPGFPPMPQMPGIPTMAPQQFAPPMPGMPPNSGMPLQQPPGAYPMGMPQMPPTQQNFAPQPPQPQQFAPPPQPAQPQQFAQATPQTGVPVKAEPSRVWGKAGKREDGTERTRRTKEEVSEDAAYEAWCRAGGDPNVGSAPAPQAVQQQVAPQQPPPQAPPMMLSPPNPFGNVAGNVPSMTTMMPPPGQFTSLPQIPMQQIVAPQPVQSSSITEEQYNQLMSRISLIEKGLAQALRVMYQSEGEADLYLVLTKVCRINP